MEYAGSPAVLVRLGLSAFVSTGTPHRVPRLKTSRINNFRAIISEALEAKLCGVKVQNRHIVL